LNQACAVQFSTIRPHTRWLQTGLSEARGVCNKSELDITQQFHHSDTEQISLSAFPAFSI